MAGADDAENLPQHTFPQVFENFNPGSYELMYGESLASRFPLPAMVYDQPLASSGLYEESHLFKFGETCCVLFLQRSGGWVAKSFYVVESAMYEKEGRITKNMKPGENPKGQVLPARQVYYLIPGGNKCNVKDTVVVEPRMCFHYACLVEKFRDEMMVSLLKIISCNSLCSLHLEGSNFLVFIILIERQQ